MIVPHEAIRERVAEGDGGDADEQNDQDDDTVNPPAQVRLDTSLKTNTLNRAGALPRTQCYAGNVSIFSHGQLKALILKTGKCMDRAWGPILQRQGIRSSVLKVGDTVKVDGFRARDGSTNALSLPDPALFAPLYGPASAERSGTAGGRRKPVPLERALGEARINRGEGELRDAVTPATRSATVRAGAGSSKVQDHERLSHARPGAP